MTITISPRLALIILAACLLWLLPPGMARNPITLADIFAVTVHNARRSIVTTTTLDTLVTEYLDLTDRIEQLGQRRDQIKAQLRELGTGKHACENLDAAVSVSAPTRRFDAAAFDRIVTDEQLRAACTETTISGKLAKQVLAPAVYELCCAEGGEPRVTVR